MELTTITKEELQERHDREIEAELKEIYLDRREESVSAREKEVLRSIKRLEKRLNVLEGIEEPEEEETDYPQVDVRVRGRINSLMQMAEDGFKEKHPEGDDKEVRFVYAPEKSDMALANFAKYRARGYTVVRVEELDVEVPEMFGGADEPVRIGDLIMMSVSKDIKEARFKALTKLAIEEAQASEEVLKASLDDELKKGSPHASAAGSFKREFRDYDVGPREEE